MSTHHLHPRTRRIAAVFALTVVTALASACANASPAAPSATPAHDPAGMPGMTGMSGMPTAGGDGLSAESSGFRFAPLTTTLTAAPTQFRFRILAGGGTPVTAFEPDQTKLMHLYLIRSDLSGFQHIHPTMAADGTWTAPLATTPPGNYRAYASFIARDADGAAVPLVLSEPLTAPGAATPTPLPTPASTTQVDGYTLTLNTNRVMSGMEQPLTVTVTRNGRPVTDLQPYLDTYAHLTALHEGDLAFAHLHPHSTANGEHGGPALTFTAHLAHTGNWRLFLQFQTAGRLHTAAVTISAA